MDGRVRIWNWHEAEPKPVELLQEREVASLALSPNGGKLVCAIGDGATRWGAARVWSLTDFQPTTPLMEHENRAFDALFSADGLAVLSRDERNARLWDANTGEALSPPWLHPGRIKGMIFTPDRRGVLTIAEDRRVRRWDVAPAREPLDYLSALATLFSSRVPDGSGAVRACAFEEFIRAHEKLSTGYGKNQSDPVGQAGR